MVAENEAVAALSDVREHLEKLEDVSTRFLEVHNAQVFPHEEDLDGERECALVAVHVNLRPELLWKLEVCHS